MVHRSITVAPRDVVNKNIMVAAIDTFVTGLFVPPFNSFPLRTMLNIKGVSYVRLEYWVILMSFLKLSWTFRFILNQILDKFANSLVLRKLAFFEPGVAFAAKVCVIVHPIPFLTTCWIIMFTLASYIIRVIEAPPMDNILPFSQAIYMCLGGFTTVGYGDAVPKSNMGRFLLAVGITLSYILISLTIVTWQTFLSLKYSEKNVIKVHQHSVLKAKLRNGAATLLTKWLKIVTKKSKQSGKKWTVELYWAMLEEVSFPFLVFRA